MSLVQPRPVLSASAHDAVIFDLDGVITDTGHLHALAWKETFDPFLARRPRADGSPRPPFDIDHDVLSHLHGRTPEDGVEAVLAARGITLPQGGPDDPVDAETVHGLVRRMQAHYLHWLRHEGPQVFPSTMALVRTLRDRGVRTAVVSASPHAEALLQAAGATDLFDVRIDRADVDRLGLSVKPAPDLLLEAAAQLGIAPARCVAVEEGREGVQAATQGGFGLVIGVDRHGEGDRLRDQGADIVVDDLYAVDVEGTSHQRPAAQPRPDGSPVDKLPSALEELRAMVAVPSGGRLAVFLDYDGTLTPIVRHPDLAVLTDEMRALVERLRDRVPVAILSGRDLDDVRAKVGVAGIWYGGSHGFDRSSPDGRRTQVAEAEPFVERLDAAADALERSLAAVPGVWVERKRFALAVHFREAPAHVEGTVRAAVDEVQRAAEGLRLKGGKKIFELQPDVPWDKGTALRHMAAALGLDLGRDRIVYLGDDETDEDAFRTLSEPGVGVLVRDPDAERRRSHARFVLDGVDEVRRFLAALDEAQRRASERPV